MVVLVDGVSAWLGIGTASVLVAIETQLQILSKGHGPRIIGQRDDWSNLSPWKKSAIRTPKVEMRLGWSVELTFNSPDHCISLN